jgi:cytochrome c-type biogenesis protein CcmH
VAALMAVAAAGAVAFPLLRHKQSRAVGAVVVVVIIGAASGLYPLWSNWNWHAPPSEAARGPGSADVAAMVAKLEARLHEHPDDLNGWLLLGRSYLTLERLDEAVTAYGHARQLDPKNADAAIGVGEAMSLRAGGEITPPAGEAFEAALALVPANPKALLYAGFAAAARGDRALARQRWEALKAMHPPQRIVEMLNARIAELGGVDAQGTSTSAAGTNSSSAPLGAAQVTVTISIAPSLKARLKSEVPLFVFAREPGSKGPPLAAKRLTTAALGTEVQLTPSDSMMPGRVLAGGTTVSVTARVSFSGQPIPAAGDLYGELSYDVGRDGKRSLVIDRIAD